jgi:hypothetical protein
VKEPAWCPLYEFACYHGQIDAKDYIKNIEHDNGIGIIEHLAPDEKLYNSLEQK